MVLAIIIHYEFMIAKTIFGSVDYKANAEVAIKEDTRRLEIPHTNNDNIRRDQNIPFALKKSFDPSEDCGQVVTSRSIRNLIHTPRWLLGACATSCIALHGTWTTSRIWGQIYKSSWQV